MEILSRIITKNVSCFIFQSFFLIKGQNDADDLKTVKLVYETAVEALPFTSDYNHGLNVLHCSICTLNSRTSTQCQQFCFDFIKIQRIIQHTPQVIDSRSCENCFEAKKIKLINSCADFCSINQLGYILGNILFIQKKIMKARSESKVFVYDPALVDTSQIDIDLINRDKPKINNVVDVLTEDEDALTRTRRLQYKPSSRSRKKSSMKGRKRDGTGKKAKPLSNETGSARTRLNTRFLKANKNNVGNIERKNQFTGRTLATNSDVINTEDVDSHHGDGDQETVPFIHDISYTEGHNSDKSSTTRKEIDEINLPINRIFTARRFTKNGNSIVNGYDQRPQAEIRELSDYEELEAWSELLDSPELPEENALQSKKQHLRQPKNSYEKWSKSDHCKYCRSIKGLPVSCDRVCVSYG